MRNLRHIKCILAIVLLSFISACNFAPGSYPYAEEYELDISEAALIEEIQAFKSNNPQFIVPKSTRLIDGRSNKDGDYWYHIYFYYPEENQIIYIWTRPVENDKTTLAFIGINQGLALGKWKNINKDFNASENKDEKKKFEERILNRIKKNL